MKPPTLDETAKLISRAVIWKYAERQSKGAWVAWPYLQFISNTIQRAILKKNGRIIINLPPRHGKSELLSRWLPTWLLDVEPTSRVILTSYGDSLARGFGRSVRDALTVYENVWTHPRSDASAVSDWLTSEGGGMITSGVGGPISGKGGNLIICDDPHKNWEEALSPTFRRRAIDWFKSTLLTRAEPGATVIVVQTRWHEDDLTGYLLDKHAKEWQLIRLPAVAEEDDLIGRRPGEPLCPVRFNISALEAIRSSIGSVVWAGLYQQRPASLVGSMIRRDWLRYWLTPPDCQELIQSWDLSFSATGSSYVVGQVWGRAGANFYLLDQIRNKLDFPDTVKAILALSARWPQATTKLIEKAANGAAVISTLQGTLSGIVAVPATSSKEVRLASVSGLIEAGNVYLPPESCAPWVGDFVAELCNFPTAANDDCVDSLTQALTYLNGHNQAAVLFELPSIGHRESPWRISA